jgi:uncharacterized protein (DUF1810 family)
MFLHWPVYALAAAGLGAEVLQQATLRLGPLSVSQPILVIVNPIVSIALSVWVFEERFTPDAAKLILGAVAFAAMCASAAVLTRTAPSTMSSSATSSGELASSPMDDPYRLDRFVRAQDDDGTYQRAAAELRAGRKVSHWMWFVFPQVAGLGFSAMSRRYAISGLAEARAYLGHPVLGPRLTDCARIVAGAGGTTAEDIFGPVDALKLRSSMTLFAAADPDEPVFGEVLARFFGGVPDEATTARL